jgi:hypothetical protein
MTGDAMKSALTILAAVALWGCAQSEPTAPFLSGPIDSPPSDPPSNPPTANANAWVWVMVIDSSGACIRGATVQVVAGQAVGEPIAQKPCSVWDYAGGVEIHNLISGVPVTLRASAPGYAPEEKTVVPFGAAQQAIIFEPHPLQ